MVLACRMRVCSAARSASLPEGACACGGLASGRARVATGSGKRQPHQSWRAVISAVHKLSCRIPRMMHTTRTTLTMVAED